jgi:hypothetical protein
MAEALGAVHMWRRLLWRWWWPVGSKLIFDQMAVPVTEIMDGSLYYPIVNFILITFPMT